MERDTPLPDLGRRQNIAIRPKPGAKGGCIFIRQTSNPHLVSDRSIVIAYGAMLNFEPMLHRRDDAEPDSRRSIVRRHPDGAGVMPQPARDGLGERHATVPPYDAVHFGMAQLGSFDLSARRCEYELIDLLHTAVRDRQSRPANLKIDASR